jgi:hypothetical protein
VHIHCVCFVLSLLFVFAARRISLCGISSGTDRTAALPLCHLILLLNTTMSHLDATTKHHILLEYSPRDSTRSFSALAARHEIKGGRATLSSWYKYWNGSAASLERKEGSGCRPLLTTAQVNRHIKPRILAANRAHRSIHYPTMLPAVAAATHKPLSLRSLRRYGKEQLKVTQRRSKKRTAQESQCTNTRERWNECVFPARRLTVCLLLLCV